MIQFSIITIKSDMPVISLTLDSDITALAKDKVYTHINLEEMTIHQVSASICYS